MRYLVGAAPAPTHIDQLVRGRHGLKNDPLPDLPPPGGVVPGRSPATTATDRSWSPCPSPARHSRSSRPTARSPARPALTARSGLTVWPGKSTFRSTWARRARRARDPAAAPCGLRRSIRHATSRSAADRLGVRRHRQAHRSTAVYTRPINDTSPWTTHSGIGTGGGVHSSMGGSPPGVCRPHRPSRPWPDAKFPFVPVFQPGVVDEASTTPVEIGNEHLPAGHPIGTPFRSPRSSPRSSTTIAQASHAFISRYDCRHGTVRQPREYQVAQSMAGMSIIVPGHRYTVRGEVVSGTDAGRRLPGPTAADAGAVEVNPGAAAGTRLIAGIGAGEVSQRLAASTIPAGADIGRCARAASDIGLQRR